MQGTKRRLAGRLALLVMFRDCKLLLLTILVSVHAEGASAGRHGCEQVEMETCKNAHWNLTSMPAFLSRTTKKVLETGCSDVLQFCICASYRHSCAAKYITEPLPPCRSVCLQAKSDCEAVLKEGISWPADLDCETFPHDIQGTCLTPDKRLPPTPSQGG